MNIYSEFLNICDSFIDSLPQDDSTSMKQNRESFHNAITDMRKLISNTMVRVPVNSCYEGFDSLLKLEAQVVTDGVFNEVYVTASRGDNRVADVVFGVDDANEIRILTTANSDGYGDHRLIIYPERDIDDKQFTIKI